MIGAATEWTRWWALMAYDVVVEPTVKGFKRGWALGQARYDRAHGADHDS